MKTVTRMTIDMSFSLECVFRKVMKIISKSLFCTIFNTVCIMTSANLCLEKIMLLQGSLLIESFIKLPDFEC